MPKHNKRGRNTNYWQSEQNAFQQANLRHGQSRSHRRYWHYQEDGTQSTSSGNHTDNTDSQDLELPGFYYDSEKKKYFRLLPGHNNYNPVTVDSLRKEKLEKQKIQISGDEKSLVTMDRSKSQSSKICGCSLPTPAYQHKLQIGSYSTHLSTRLGCEKVVRQLKLRSHSVFEPTPFNEQTNTVCNMQADSKNKKVALVVKSTMHTMLAVTTVVPDKNDARKIVAAKWEVDMMQLNEKSIKVTNIQWISHRKEDNSHLLLSYICNLTGKSGVQVLRIGDLTPCTASTRCIYKNLINDSAWTCAWSYNSQYSNSLSVGLSKAAVIIDISTGRKRVCFSHNSDVFAQTFAVKSPLLFNGTRKGFILGCDLRTPHTATIKGLNVKHSSPVCCVKLLKDENYLVASDMTSKILLWDLRSLKQVMEYEGHSNDHLHIPFHIDSTETVLYSGGMDTCVRFWSLKDGHRLSTIASPGGVESTPLIQYSCHWSEQNIPGMLMACERGLNWYTV